MKRFTFLALLTPSLFAQEQFDAVSEGKKTFDTMGCMECHVNSPNDDSLKTGPSLYGLFLTTPQDRAVVAKGSEKPVTVKADQAYFVRSVRRCRCIPKRS
jgi:cytochrome c2